jgi:hypothetical protein
MDALARPLHRRLGNPMHIRQPGCLCNQSLTVPSLNIRSLLVKAARKLLAFMEVLDCRGL